MSYQKCSICGIESDNIIKVVRGQQKLIEASEQRDDGRKSVFEDADNIFVHTECRKNYIKPQSIEAYKRKQKNEDSACSPGDPTGSVLLDFNIREKCFICGEKVEIWSRSKKTKSCAKVQGKDFQKNIVKICELQNDDYSTAIQLRISAHDLIAVGAQYHLNCYATFKTRRSEQVGRPAKSKVAFEKLCSFIDNSDECQYSTNELQAKLMELDESREEVYSNR